VLRATWLCLLKRVWAAAGAGRISQCDLQRATIRGALEADGWLIRWSLATCEGAIGGTSCLAAKTLSPAARVDSDLPKGLARLDG
jgi:hypothetical protein